MRRDDLTNHPVNRHYISAFRGQRQRITGINDSGYNGASWMDIRTQRSYASLVFTGLIEEVGGVVEVRDIARGTQLQISAPRIAKEIRSGDSIVVNGCCLTLSSQHNDLLTFDLLEETIARTNLRTLRRDAQVNLERALSTERRFGGHFVQGHIDCTSRIFAFRESRGDHRLEVELPNEFAHYVVNKGSIAINGISLTIAEVLPKSFVVWIIPYTKRHTNLDRAQVGDLLNLEFDILAKYVERMLSLYIQNPNH
jgi:riboflavin synthase